MPDLHGWISQKIDAVEKAAQLACRRGAAWTYDDWSMQVRLHSDGEHVGEVVASASYGYGQHITTHDPEAALRRCAADRKILAIHGYHGGTYDALACTGCGYDDMGYLVDHVNDCETLLALAEGYGITDEGLAALERPELERQTRPGGKSALQVIDEFLWGMTEARQAPTPVERALDILSPHLRDVPLYRPTA